MAKFSGVREPSPKSSHTVETRRTPQNLAALNAVMDRDAPNKQLGDITVSPVSSARRNVLAIAKCSWSRIKLKLRHHPLEEIS